MHNQVVTPLFQTPSGLSLNPDISRLILTQLQASNSISALSQLRACSKRHYEAVTPYGYTDITVTFQQFLDLLKPLTSTAPDQVSGRFVRSLPGHETDVWAVEPAARIRWCLSHVRRITFYQSKLPSFKDDTNSDSIVAIAVVLNKLAHVLLFPDLESIQFKLNLTTEKNRHEFATVLKVLSQTCLPKNLCFTLLDEHPSKCTIFPSFPLLWPDLEVEAYLVFHNISNSIPYIPTANPPRVSLVKHTCGPHCPGDRHCGTRYYGQQKRLLLDQASDHIYNRGYKKLKIIPISDDNIANGCQGHTRQDLEILKKDVAGTLLDMFVDHPDDTENARENNRKIREWAKRFEWGSRDTMGR